MKEGRGTHDFFGTTFICRGWGLKEWLRVPTARLEQHTPGTCTAPGWSVVLDESGCVRRCEGMVPRHNDVL